MAKTKIPAFKNEEYKDFTLTRERRAMENAIETAEKNLAKKYPLIIDGKGVFTEKAVISRNPARPKEVIGHFAHGTQDHAELALQAASNAFKSWSKVPFEKRAKLLFNASKIAKRRRYEINAWMVKEVGKNWSEADADTAEAIDFMEFYAREMLRLGGPKPVHQLKC